jgi:hypothetical protein
MVKPCLHQALVKRLPLNLEEGEEPVEQDEVIGFVISNDQIIPADETSDGVHFMWYINNAGMNQDEWVQYVTVTVPNWAQQWHDKHHPVIQIVPDEVLELEPKSRKRR